jgi:DNA-binding MarR family transcriptional regulator
MLDVPAVAREVMALYPRIYFACHSRHVRDPQTQKPLSRHQASVLDHLDEVEPTTLNDLARHMGVTASTMSLMIDRLERKGYVVRLRDAADRRRVHLRLTSGGVRVRQASSVLDPPRVEAMVSRLSGEEREAALRGLALLARAAQDQMAHGTRADPPEARMPRVRDRREG